MLVVALACLGSVALAVPQDPALRPLAGRVLDQLGEPVEGAAVVFLHRPLPRSLDPFGAHRVRVETGRGGMFRAELREGRSYSVWAGWPDGATSVEEGVEAGGFLTLTQDALARARSIGVSGVDAWAERGPLKFRTVVGGENVDFVPLREVDGVFELPPLPPFPSRPVEVLDRHGEVLWAARPAHDPERGEVLVVPAPFELDVVVRDATGAPLAGAEVRYHICNYWATNSPAVPAADRFLCLWPVAGTTDVDGRLRARVPARRVGDAPPPDLHLMARAPGHRGGLGGFHDGQPYRMGERDEDAGDALEFVLEEIESVPRRIFVERHRPMVRGAVFAVWRVHVRAGTGKLGMPFTETIPFEDGRLEFPALPPSDGDLEAAWTVLPETFRSALVERHGCTMPTAFRLPLEDGWSEQDLVAALHPDELVPVQVVTPGGRPAERALVLVSSLEIPRGRRIHFDRLRTDRLGRVLVPRDRRGVRVAVLARDAYGAIELAPDSVRERPYVDLRPMKRVVVRVLDSDGEPVGGVLVSTAGFVATGDGPADVGELHPLELRQIASELGRGLTDTEGRAHIASPPCPGQLRISLSDPDRPWTAPVRDAFDAGAPPSEVVLTWVQAPPDRR